MFPIGNRSQAFEDVLHIGIFLDIFEENLAYGRFFEAYFSDTDLITLDERTLFLLFRLSKYVFFTPLKVSKDFLLHVVNLATGKTLCLGSTNFGTFV